MPRYRRTIDANHKQLVAFLEKLGVQVARNGLPCVYVGRPTKWGNPFKVGDTRKHSHIPIYDTYTVENALTFYRGYLLDWLDEDEDARLALEQLRGKNLACWCAEDAPCHTDILLEEANK